MKNTKILIVDDEVLIAEDLKDNLLSFGVKNIEMAHDKEGALEMLHKFDPEVILLDIRMENETDGIEIGEYIAKNTQKLFIYITAHSDVEMIRKIIKTRPVAYITKPVKKSDLYASISLAVEQLNTSTASNFRIKDGYSTVIIPVDSILYIESEGNYINIYCDEKKYVSRQSLDSVVSELDTSQFFRIHRSYLINTLKVKRFSKKEVAIGNATLPVSRNLGDELEKFMLEKS
ncbi:MAG TPA: response regulator transcription factor [Flavobacteriales bacterium]|nr:response regulator transcription factor [Flavobacteriales bacterium]